MPTWEETADFYGLSKSDRKFISSLFEKKGTPAKAKSPLKTGLGMRHRDVNGTSDSRKRDVNGMKSRTGVTRKLVTGVRKSA
jgi:hypothetical protein